MKQLKSIVWKIKENSVDIKDDLNKLNTEENLLKNTVLSTNNTFKAAFGATMGFYFAQLLPLC
jgi:hypothetical protein